MLRLLGRNFNSCIMRIILIFFLFIALACNRHPGSQQNVHSDHSDTSAIVATGQNQPDSVLQFLITSCVSDILHQGRTLPVLFSASYLGYKQLPTGEKQFLLCGKFQSKVQEHKDIWIPFATIQTSGYEQWIGAQAVNICQDSTIVWDRSNDLSLSLQAQFDSLMKE